MYRQIKFLTMNVGSLISTARRTYLEELLLAKRPDVVMICETHLKSRHTLRIGDYAVLRCDYGKGTALMFRMDLRLSRETLVFNGFVFTAALGRIWRPLVLREAGCFSLPST